MESNLNSEELLKQLSDTVNHFYYASGIKLPDPLALDGDKGWSLFDRTNNNGVLKPVASVFVFDNDQYIRKVANNLCLTPVLSQVKAFMEQENKGNGEFSYEIMLACKKEKNLIVLLLDVDIEETSKVVRGKNVISLIRKESMTMNLLPENNADMRNYFEGKIKEFANDLREKGLDIKLIN